LMESVHIPSARQRFDAYPHQLSGGTKQRILIGMALANEPDLIIADEPTTALDVTVQAQVLALFQEIQAQMGLSVLFITHNLGVAAQIAQRIIVLYAGRVAEIGPAARLTQRPHHPYSTGLLHSIPAPGAQQVRLEPIAGQPPDLTRLPQGCAFAPRCASAMNICRQEVPPLKVLDGVDHVSACVLP
jgi:oligopeptide/dipeptide ABC transporter ATP-binding protein